MKVGLSFNMIDYKISCLLLPILSISLLFTGCGDGGAGKRHQVNELIRRGMNERVLNMWHVIQQHVEFERKGYTDPECATYDHPVYGCSGRCMLTNDCPGGVENTVEGLCESQPFDIRCCFTANTTKECATFDHFLHGKTGHCTKTSKCPDVNYINELCPDKGDDVECCFSKPVGNCPLLITDESSNVPDDCLRCMCKASSNCTNTEPICRQQGEKEYCGPYQISQRYWLDASLSCKDIGQDWRNCSRSFDCSRATVQAYMKRYAIKSGIGHRPTCEDFARIHKGGPNGHLHYSTLSFWSSVRSCLEGG